jgi:hypothetical protein
VADFFGTDDKESIAETSLLDKMANTWSIKKFALIHTVLKQEICKMNGKRLF